MNREENPWGLETGSHNHKFKQNEDERRCKPNAKLKSLMWYGLDTLGTSSISGVNEGFTSSMGFWKIANTTDICI